MWKKKVVQQKFMFLCVEHSPVNVQFRCNSFFFLWLGNQLDFLVFFFSPSVYPFHIFLGNRMMIEPKCCSRLHKFVNDISKSNGFNRVCRHRQQSYMVTKSLPAFCVCHNGNMKLCQPQYKKCKVLEKLD